MSLEGRHALVTGGGRGIGAAIAAALARAGAQVMLLARDAERLERAVVETGAAGFVAADVTDAVALHGAWREAEERCGPVSILVNNAGAAEAAPFHRSDEDLLRRMLAVNLESVFALTRLALPAMREAGDGRIVNVASTAGLKGYPYVTAYCAAKHGVIGLTRALAMETAKTGVTVNAVCPGYTDTDLVRDSADAFSRRSGRSAEEYVAELARSNPQGRLVEPQEVADAVLFLARPESRSITGQAIVVAGGEVM